MRSVYVPHTMRLPLYWKFPICLTIKTLYCAFVPDLFKFLLTGGRGGSVLRDEKCIYTSEYHKTRLPPCYNFPIKIEFPLHCYEFVPPKSFSKTFKFSIIFCSTCKISGGGQFRKECRSRKKNRNHWKSRTNSRTLLEPFLRSRKEKNL